MKAGKVNATNRTRAWFCRVAGVSEQARWAPREGSRAAADPGLLILRGMPSLLAPSVCQALPRPPTHTCLILRTVRRLRTWGFSPLLGARSEFTAHWGLTPERREVCPLAASCLPAGVILLHVRHI